MKQLVFLSILFFCMALHAQPDWKCGTARIGIPASELAYRSDTTLLYIPVTVNILGDNNGNGYYAKGLVLQALCKLQTDFAPHRIQFYIAGDFNYINNAAFYNMSATYAFSDEMNQFVKAHNTQNTMNIYIVQYAQGWSFVTGADPYLDYSTYPPITLFNQSDGIVLAKNHLTNLQHLFAHEVGHFFGLNHTFDGSDWAEFQINGTPDTVFYSQYDPITDSTLNLYWLVERVDGILCDVAGDFICDTPPDYLYGFTCNMNQQSDIVQTDPVGVNFRSDGTLYMSYSNDACQTRFSPGQVERMRTVVQGGRSYLLNNQNPPPPAPSNLTLVYPPDMDSIFVGDSITLQWDIQGADFYLLEFGRLIANQVHAPLLRDVLLTNNTYSVGSNPGQTYYWKITGVNKYHPCTTPADTSYFVTKTALSMVETTRDQQQLRVYPNPVTDHLYIHAEQLASICISLFDPWGNLALQQMVSGEGMFNMKDLPPGLYTLRAVSGDRVFSGKIVKQ